MRAWARAVERTHEISTTPDNPEYIPTPSPGGDKLLLEDGASFALLESSDKILLE
jgi:hypothetical protein